MHHEELEPLTLPHQGKSSCPNNKKVCTHWLKTKKIENFIREWFYIKKWSPWSLLGDLDGSANQEKIMGELRVIFGGWLGKGWQYIGLTWSACLLCPLQRRCQPQNQGQVHGDLEKRFWGQRSQLCWHLGPGTWWGNEACPTLKYPPAVESFQVRRQASQRELPPPW